MNIIEVVKEANKQNRGITRESWGPNPQILIPTNTSLCFIGETENEKLVPRWQPIANDILADDWKVYG